MRRQARPHLTAQFGREDSAVLLATAQFSDARTAVQHMVEFVESQGAGSWVFLTDARTNGLKASVYWSSTTGEIYCAGELLAAQGENASLQQVKELLESSSGPLGRPRSLE